MAPIQDSFFSNQTMKQGAFMENVRNKCLKSSEVIIVGDGITCSALAYTFGKDGQNVHVIMERDMSDHDRIEDKLLQPEECLKLIELGIEDCVGGRSFNSQSFTMQMSEKASSLPNVRWERGWATSLVEEKGIVKGVHYKNKLGEGLTANALLTIFCNNSSLKRSPSATVGAVFVEDASSKPAGEETLANSLSDVVLLRDLIRPLYNSHDVSSLSKCLESFYTLRKVNMEPRSNHLSLGGECPNASVALLPGQNPWQLILLLRFSAVPVMWCWTLVTFISSPLSNAFRMLWQL